MIQWYSRLFFDKLMRKMTTNMTLQRKTTSNFTLHRNRDISFTVSFILRAINKCYILTMLLILLLPLLVDPTQKKDRKRLERISMMHMCMRMHDDTLLYAQSWIFNWYFKRYEYSTKMHSPSFKLINKDWIFQ